jgi:PadR family transcriptional regulator, regulatory protein PadR
MNAFSKNLVAASVEPLLLTLLADGQMYGYEIIQQVHELSGGRIRWSASKLYPLLHHLENEGLVKARWYPSESGPDRKYYQLTPKGEAALEATKRDWLEVNAILARLWGPGFALTHTTAT